MVALIRDGYMWLQVPLASLEAAVQQEEMGHWRYRCLSHVPFSRSFNALPTINFAIHAKAPHCRSNFCLASAGATGFTGVTGGTGTTGGTGASGECFELPYAKLLSFHHRFSRPIHDKRLRAASPSLTLPDDLGQHSTIDTLVYAAA